MGLPIPAGAERPLRRASEGHRGDPGGILALVDLIDEHPTQVEYELLRFGQRLRWFPTPTFSWGDLLVVLVHAPEDSPLKRALAECGHSTSEHLQLLLHHALAGANWQRGDGKERDRPKLPDCMLPPELRPEVKQLGDARMTLDEAADWLGWNLPDAT